MNGQRTLAVVIAVMAGAFAVVFFVAAAAVVLYVGPETAAEAQARRKGEERLARMTAEWDEQEARTTAKREQPPAKPAPPPVPPPTPEEIAVARKAAEEARSLLQFVESRRGENGEFFREYWARSKQAEAWKEIEHPRLRTYASSPGNAVDAMVNSLTMRQSTQEARRLFDEWMRELEEFIAQHDLAPEAEGPRRSPSSE